MEIDSSLEALRNLCQEHDWFSDTGVDEYGRLVVFIKYQCEATLRDIPASINGKQILVHFASSLTATREKYTDQDMPVRTCNPSTPPPPSTDSKLELVDETEYSLYYAKHSVSVDDLVQELDRLEKICGSNILQDIFYEIHDGSNNAVTNLSSKYPEVRDMMEKLYDEYGFDIIYEELDG